METYAATTRNHTTVQNGETTNTLLPGANITASPTTIGGDRFCIHWRDTNKNLWTGYANRHELNIITRVA